MADLEELSHMTNTVQPSGANVAIIHDKTQKIRDFMDLYEVFGGGLQEVFCRAFESRSALIEITIFLRFYGSQLMKKLPN